MPCRFEIGDAKLRLTRGTVVAVPLKCVTVCVLAVRSTVVLGRSATATSTLPAWLRSRNIRPLHHALVVAALGVEDGVGAEAAGTCRGRGSRSAHRAELASMA